jgi:hypothetical protein
MISSATNARIIDNKIYGAGGACYPGSSRGLYFTNSTGMAQDNFLYGFAVANVSIEGMVPDLGGGGLSTGGNTFECACAADVSVAIGGQTLHAEQNLWDHATPTTSTTCSGGVDFCSPGDSLDAAGSAVAGGACP